MFPRFIHAVIFNLTQIIWLWAGIKSLHVVVLEVTDRVDSQGGTLMISLYLGSGLASTVHPQKISGISSTPKNIWNSSNP